VLNCASGGQFFTVSPCKTREERGNKKAFSRGKSQSASPKRMVPPGGPTTSKRRFQGIVCNAVGKKEKRFQGEGPPKRRITKEPPCWTQLNHTGKGGGG